MKSDTKKPRKPDNRRVIEALRRTLAGERELIVTLKLARAEAEAAAAPNKALEEELAALRETNTTLAREAHCVTLDYGRYSQAINELMRDVLRFVGDPLSNPTSINGGQLIAALEKASHTIHDRSR